jgi:hypothetical protein
LTIVPFLTPAERRSILDKVLGAIDTKFMGPDVDTQVLRLRHEASVLNAETSDELESAFNGLLRDLGVSHTGFFHEATPRAAGRIAIAATFTKADTRDAGFFRMYIRVELRQRPAFVPETCCCPWLARNSPRPRQRRSRSASATK